MYLIERASWSIVGFSFVHQLIESHLHLTTSAMHEKREGERKKGRRRRERRKRRGRRERKKRRERRERTRGRIRKRRRRENKEVNF